MLTDGKSGASDGFISRGQSLSLTSAGPFTDQRKAKEMKSIGRFLQVVALVALPISMMLQIFGFMGRTIGLNQMLIMLVFGIIAFLLGRMLEGYSPDARS